MYQYKVVHIPYIVLDSEPFFYVVVEVVEDSESYKLRYLGAKPQAYISERVHNFTSPSSYLLVFNALAYCRFCYVVSYALEIVVYIALEHPPLAPVLGVITAQMRRHTV